MTDNSVLTDEVRADLKAKSLGEKLCEAMPPYAQCWSALTDASRTTYEKAALRFAASLTHDETATATIQALTARAEKAEQAIREAIDLLLERVHHNPARSAAHNARLTLQAALSPSNSEADNG